MKDVLLLIRDDAGQPARIEAAAALARLLGGQITCLELDETPLMGDEIAATSVDGRVLQEVVRGQCAANRTRVEHALQDRRATWTWISGRGKLAEQVADQAAFHDVTVLNTQPRSYSWRDSSFVVSEVARATHQPLLLVPDASDSTGFDRQAIVAWDGSPPCIAALRAAVPLLAHARHVAIIEVGEHDAGPTVERAADYLRRHDIHPHVEREGGRAPADALLAHCRPGRTSYCVMGAFGRSRGHEAVFGGTTLDMLDAAAVPLFVAH